MCQIIVIKDKEIATPRQFEEYFGFAAEKHSYYTGIDVDDCLCQVDFRKALKEHNILFNMGYNGDIYIK